jgi:amidophosphoribosyltransferase
LIFAGEMVELSKEGVKSVYIAPRPNKEPTAFCIFEYVYFARTDSIFEGTITLLPHKLVSE